MTNESANASSEQNRSAEPSSTPEPIPTPPHRRLSGCGWVLLSTLLIVATTAFCLLWPIHRANQATRTLSMKQAEVNRMSYYKHSRPWYMSVIDEETILPGIDFVDIGLLGKEFSDEDVSDLLALNRIGDLSIFDTNLTTDGLRRLAGLHDVRTLSIAPSTLDDDDLNFILQSDWNLSMLYISSPNLTQTAWESIIRCKELATLELECPGMTLTRDLPELRAMAKLQWLSLNQLRLTPGGATRLAEVPGLETLRLSQCRLSTLDFSAFASVKSFEITESDCTEADRLAFRIPTGAEAVVLNDFPLGETNPGLFTGLPQLTTLDLQRSTFTDQHLHDLASCTNLGVLNLTDCKQVGDAQIPLLLAIPNLYQLDLTGTSVTPAGIKQLRESRPELEVVDTPLPK